MPGSDSENFAGEAVPLREFIEAMLNERRHSMDVVAVERQKAIAAQLASITASLDSAQALQTERIESVRRETRIMFEESEKAILKAEAAINERLDLLNEFRAQAADEASKYALRDSVDQRLSQLMDEVSGFMPREVADSQFAEMRRTLTDLTEKVGKLV